MARINDNIREKVRKIALKLAKNRTLAEDCYDEGLKKICEMSYRHTDSYLIQYAYRAIQNFLIKERSFSRKNLPLPDEFEGFMPEDAFDFGFKTTVPKYPETS